MACTISLLNSSTITYYQSFLLKFGSNPTVSAAVDAAVSSIRRPGKQGAAEKTAMLDDSATSASPQTSEAEEEGEGEGEGDGENSLPEASHTCETDTAADCCNRLLVIWCVSCSSSERSSWTAGATMCVRSRRGAGGAEGDGCCVGRSTVGGPEVICEYS